MNKSKHSSYMIRGQRLSRRNREDLMRLVVRLDKERQEHLDDCVEACENLVAERGEVSRLNNLLDAAVEFGDKMRKARNDLNTAYSAKLSVIDNLETSLSKAIAAAEDYRVRLVESDKRSKRRFAIIVDLAVGGTVSTLLAIGITWGLAR